MRGAERPGKVKWTRPFLAPLEAIPTRASSQTFIDIAREPTTAGDETALEELVGLTGNLPLAVVLMAKIASFEGYLGIGLHTVAVLTGRRAAVYGYPSRTRRAF
jgi:hypothetical protein